MQLCTIVCTIFTIFKKIKVHPWSSCCGSFALGHHIHRRNLSLKKELQVNCREGPVGAARMPSVPHDRCRTESRLKESTTRRRLRPKWSWSRPHTPGLRQSRSRRGTPRCLHRPPADRRRRCCYCSAPKISECCTRYTIRQMIWCQAIWPCFHLQLFFLWVWCDVKSVMVMSVDEFTMFAAIS